MELVRAAAILTLGLLWASGCDDPRSAEPAPVAPRTSRPVQEAAREAAPATSPAPAPPPATEPPPSPALVPPPPPAPSPAPPSPPAAEPAPPADAEPSGPVVLRLYPLGEVTPDPFGRRRPPRGVELFYTERVERRVTMRRDRGPIEGGRRGDAWISRTAQIHPVADESLAQTIARVRPWFERLRIAGDERWLFDLPRPRPERNFADVYLVSGPPIEVHRSDIHEVAVTEPFGEAHGLAVCWSRQGTRRLPPLTRALENQRVAFAVEDGVLWAPLVGGPIGSSPKLTAMFLHGNRALGERLRAELLRGGDEVRTEPGSSFRCSGP